MKSFLKMLLAVLIAQVLLVCIGALIVVGKMKDEPKVEDGSVLVQVLDGAIPEYPPQGDLPFPGRGGPSHIEIMENLEKARHDERIKAVVLRLGAPRMGMARLDELRERIAQLQAAGKPVWAHTDWLSRGTLYIGSACDSLFVMPGGYVSLRGFAAGRPFVKGTLEKLGIKENLHKIENYKAAAEMIQRDDMSATARENIEWILDELYPAYVTTVEKDRHLAAGTLESKVFAEGVISVYEAVDVGLVDRLLYWDEVETRLLEIVGVEQDKEVEEGLEPRPRRISGGDYADIDRKKAGIKTKKKIAVVMATGMIGGEESGMNFPFGASMGSATMERAFREAAEDEDIAGIMYRINSGGGESSTSWRIQRAAVQASRAKPMVVSMSDVAGSGGYLICYPLKPLIANRHSVVGSIGSISGKFNMRELYNKLGITWDFATRGPNALMESDYFDYTREQFDSFKQRHWRDYHDWVEDIAHFRGKTAAEIDSVGRGRIFTGEQALANGLIDELGSFDDAVRLLKEKAEIPADEEVEFVYYPKKKGLLESLMSGGFATALFWLIDDITGPFQREGTWAIDMNQYY
jgi:protease-4